MNIKRCESCGERVIPTFDNFCPSCRRPFVEAFEDPEKAGSSFRPRSRRHEMDPNREATIRLTLAGLNVVLAVVLALTFAFEGPKFDSEFFVYSLPILTAPLMNAFLLRPVGIMPSVKGPTWIIAFACVLDVVTAAFLFLRGVMISRHSISGGILPIGFSIIIFSTLAGLESLGIREKGFRPPPFLVASAGLLTIAALLLSEFSSEFRVFFYGSKTPRTIEDAISLSEQLGNMADLTGILIFSAIVLSLLLIIVGAARAKVELGDDSGEFKRQ